MLVLQTLAPWLLLAFLGQQVSVSSGVRNKNRGADHSVTAAPGRAQRGGNKPAASGKGKFSIKDSTMQCSWAAQDVGEKVRVLVKCEDPEARIKGGETDIRCHYNGKPQSCPGYQSDNKGFWKQVDRAFKRLQGKVCRDDRRQVRAVMCKRAPRDAHFKLDISSSVVSAQSGGYEEAVHRPPPTRRPHNSTQICTKRANHKKTAEEKCSGSWASVCNFFMSMLQSEDDC